MAYKEVHEEKMRQTQPRIKVAAESKGVIAPKRADGTLGSRSITRVRVKDVLVGDGRRESDPEQVQMMEESMATRARYIESSAW